MEVAPPDKIEPIAVVGLGCRFPGDATSPQALWDMLLRGDSAWSEFPENRVRISAYFHPSASRQGGICFRGAHFLKQNVAAFDSSFFSIPADEAKAVDPQQRMLLEVTVEALDSAGIDRNAIRKSETGVWIGSFVKDYEQISLRDYDNQPQYGATGNGTAIMSNRISYFLDVNGPSMTIDTGCSASLVCVHQACQSLITRETDMAIAGGAGLILTPNTMMPMTALNFLSPDGKCYTFDARANGYGRGEGIGIVILKRLTDAIRDNDNIRAVIRGTRLNQDGRTAGITLPSTEAQIKNMRGVYERAGLDPARTAYVECHGTGTQAGDTRELRALSQSICSTRTFEKPVYVGSIKTNMGHLEGAAGVAGLIKGILTVEKGMIPKHINFEAPGNPAIDFQGWGIKALTGLRRASVNSFGFGGTNAHAVIDDAAHYLAERGICASHNTAFLGDTPDPSCRPLHERKATAMAVKAWRRTATHQSQGESVPQPESKSHVFVFSAHDQHSLLRMVQNQAQYVSMSFVDYSDPTHILENLAYTLGCRRTKMNWRTSVVAKSPEQLVTKLLALKKSDVTRTSEDKRPNIALVFSGQGAQWHGMGRELLGFDVYLESIAGASKYMTDKLGSEFSLLAELLKDKNSSRINKPEISQTATTAVQIALVDFLIHRCGIIPTSVVGHSSGEIAAAYASGAISRENAWELAYYRGLAAKSLTDIKPYVEGRMLAVGLSEFEAGGYLGNAAKGRITIACINSPSSVTLSGDADAIEEIQQMLNRDGVFNRLLVVDIAYHSHHVLRCADGYSNSIAHILSREPARSVLKHPYARGKLLNPSDLDMDATKPDQIPENETTTVFSSVTRNPIDWQYLNPAYWRANFVSPVYFHGAVTTMMHREDGKKPDIVIEVGPHAALQGPLQQIFDSDPIIRQPPKYFPMLKRGEDATMTVLETVGELWARGCRIDLGWALMRNIQMQGPRMLVDLPNYPWNHESLHWYESHLSKANRLGNHGRYDLIGRPTPDSIPFQPRWRGFLRVMENPWIEHHRVQKTTIYPAAGMIAMVLEGAKQVASVSAAGIEISQFTIEKAMMIPATEHGLEYALNMSRQETERRRTPHKSSYAQLSAAPSTSYEFSIYSKPFDGEWQQHGSGIVIVYHKVDAADGLTGHQNSYESDLRTKHHYDRYLSANQFCDNPVIPRQLYEGLDVIGMNYGPLFQNIISLSKRDDTCAFVVRIPDIKAIMPEQFEYPHIVHPATLDSVFQTAFSFGSDSMVPSYISSIYVSMDPPLPSEAGNEFVGYAKAKHQGLREASVSFTLSDHSWRDSVTATIQPPLVIIKDMKFTRVSTNLDLGAARFIPDHHNLCSQIIWEPVLDLDLELPLRQGITQLSGLVQILVPEEMDCILASLCELFCERLNCTSITLTQIKAGHKQSAYCLCLLELLPEHSFIYDWSEDDYNAIRTLFSSTRGLLWVTRDAQIDPSNPKASMFQALARTIRSETPKTNLATLDISKDTNLVDHKTLELITALSLSVFLNGTQVESRDTDFAERNSQLLVPRLQTIPSLNRLMEQGNVPSEPITGPMTHHQGRSLKLKIAEIGHPETFYWDDDQKACGPLATDAVSIRVLSAGISDLDVNVVAGRTRDHSLGTDAYGSIEALGQDVHGLNVGDRVLAVVRGSLRQSVMCHWSLVQKVPHDTDASVVVLPTALAMADYTIHTLASLKTYHSILIHAGATSFGRAAIRFAQHIGAEVFATAMNGAQRHVLEHDFQIPREMILDGNNNSFIEPLLRLTLDKGVDVIFDPTSDYRESNRQCVANLGHVISLTRKDTVQGQVVDFTGKSFTFSAVDFAYLIKKEPWRLGESLKFICSNDISKWLPDCCSIPKAYSFQELPQAFSGLVEGDQSDIIYCVASEETAVPIMPPRQRSVKERLRADGTYAIAGQGGLGMHIARMLAMNGVKHIALLSRSGAASDASLAAVTFLEHRGVNVKVLKVDICDKESLKTAVDEIRKTMPPVRGLFQCAAVLRDAVFDTMTYDGWQTAVRPKTTGSWNLFELFPQDMDFLIFLSSSVGVIGNRGQSNYAAGNAFQDALARNINGKGSMHSVSIDLGPVLGAGMLTEDSHTLDKLKATGFFGVRLQDFERIVERAITGYTEGDERMPPQVAMGVGTGGLIRQNKPADPYWTRTALFTHLNKVDIPPDSNEINSTEETGEQTIRMLLTNAETIDEVHDIVVVGLCTVLATSMGKQAEDIDDGLPPSAYGVDSLVAVAMRNWVYRECDVDVSVFEILSDSSISRFAKIIVERSTFGKTAL
ncbi:hypothetical protein BKA67DRAFT_531802 [Truncatella angustata]|uniref:Polyketide synthase n=1 Tax=Truncatella angustata TaxID=152316 RepID=A0A9P8ZYW7_9PEZI|nr:uncharacterized protein BKA67DRAFT_531802 [Truncatella angustata]KAH6656537.1 hypothetical protein BKA67DRAFT_531802 [Truncatella angustata]